MKRDMSYDTRNGPTTNNDLALYVRTAEVQKPGLELTQIQFTFQHTKDLFFELCGQTASCIVVR